MMKAGGLLGNMAMGEAYISIILNCQLFKSPYQDMQLDNAGKITREVSDKQLKSFSSFQDEYLLRLVERIAIRSNLASYLPLNTGSRFSKYALVASWKSSDFKSVD